MFIATAVTGIVNGHDEGEVNYGEGVVRNLTNGKSAKIRKWPRIIEKFYKSGGLLAHARERLVAEAQGK